MNITIHKTAQVAGGYEYFYSIFDDDGNVLAGNQFQHAGTTLPTTTETEAWITERLERFTAELAEVEVQPETKEVSTVDSELLTLKTQVKEVALGAMKADAAIEIEGIVTVVTDTLGSLAGKMTEAFVEMYIQEAYDRGLIAENTYVALRAFVASLTIAQIQEIK